MLEIEEVIPAGTPEVLDTLIDGSTALTLTDRTEAAMTLLEETLRGKTFDLATTAGNKEARDARMRLVKLRTGLDRLRKDQNAEHKAIIDGNNAFAKSITERIVALEAPIDAAIKADEDSRAAEKAERDRIERERILSITAKVQAIKELPLSLMLVGSARLTEEIDRLTDLAIDEGEYAEFSGEAMQAKEVTLLKLGAMRADAFEREETARKQKEEADRLKAEREAQEAAEAQRRIEAEAKAKAEREAAEAKAAADKAAANAIAQAAAEKLAEAQALLAEAKRVQEENERREQHRLFLEAEERARQERENKAEAEYHAEKIPAPPGHILNLSAEEIATEQAIEAQISTGAAMAAPIIEVCGMLYPLNDGIPPAPQDAIDERPSNAEIIKAVADAFDVDAETALSWIFEISAEEPEGALKQAT